MANITSSGGGPGIAVIGGGAAGLMAAIFAARQGANVVVLDGAAKLGAKILISGGGRCNVTHDVVRPGDFNGSRGAIAKVLRTFDVAATVAFFASIGVELKREEEGKLFPVSDKARTVLDALLLAAREAGVEIRSGQRVIGLTREGAKFAISVAGGDQLGFDRVILATGGRSVPKTGSDGAGYELARSLGHTITPIFPALVPLVLPEGHWMTRISGTSVDAEVAVRSGTGRVVHRERGSMLFTHFGLSGPVVLDISRHWIAEPAGSLVANLLPGESFESLDAKLIAEAKRNPRATVGSYFRGMLSERLVEAIRMQNAEGRMQTGALSQLTREARRELVRNFVELPLPVVRDRGFDYAEVTAGGVPLSEVDLRTMESRVASGLFLCGEILDVDGKIGGYNFQWAWASGRLAGKSVMGPMGPMGPMGRMGLRG